MLMTILHESFHLANTEMTRGYSSNALWEEVKQGDLVEFA